MSNRSRRVIRLVLLGATVPVAVAAGFLAFVSSSPGRAWVLSHALGLVNAEISGTLEAEELSELSLGGLALTGLRVRDPDHREVIGIEQVEVRWDLLALTGRTIRLRDLVVRKGRVDAETLSDEESGLMAAFALRRESTDGAQPGRPLTVRIDAIRVEHTEVKLPAPAGETLLLSGVGFAGSLRFGPEVWFRVDRLAAGVVRNGAPVGSIGPLTAGVTAEGSYTLEGAVRLGETRVPLSFRAPAAIASDWMNTAFRARLSVEGLSPDTLRLLQLDAAADHLLAPIDVDIEVEGTVQENRTLLQLHSPAGTVQGEVSTSGMKRARFTVATVAFEPSRVVEPGPSCAVDLSIEGELERVSNGYRWQTSLRRIRLGELLLPDIQAQGLLSGDSLQQLRIEAREKSVSADLQGEVFFDGSGRLQGSLDAGDLRDLGGLESAAGLGGELHAKVDVALPGEGRVEANGSVRAASLSHGPLRAAVLDLRFEADGPLRSPRLEVQASGRSLGWKQYALSRAHLQASGGPQTYAFALDGRSPSRAFRLKGRARRLHNSTVIFMDAYVLHSGRRWSASVTGLRISDDFDLRLEGMKLSRGDSYLHARGSIGRGGRVSSELRFHALQVKDLTDLAGIAQPSKAQLQGEASLRGSFDQPIAKLDTEIRNIAYADQPAANGHLTAEMDLRQGKASADLRLGDTDGARVDLQLEATLPRAASVPKRLRLGRYRVNASLRALPLSRFEPMAPALLRDVEGTLRFDLEASGTVADPRVDLRFAAPLRHAAGAECGTRPYRVEGGLSVGDGRYEVEVRIPSEDGLLVRALGRGPLATVFDHAMRNDTAFRLDELRLSVKEAPLSEVPVACRLARGSLSAEIEVIDSGEAPLVSAALEAAGLAVGEIPPVDGRVRAQADGKRATIAVEVTRENGSADLDLDFPISWQSNRPSMVEDGPLEGSLHVQQWPVRWLAALVAELDDERRDTWINAIDPEDVLWLRARAGGTLAEPRLSLDARSRLRNVSGGLAGRFSIRYGERQAQARIAVDDGAGRWIAATGEMSIDRSPNDFLSSWPQSLSEASWSLDLSARPRPLEQLPLAFASRLGGLPARLSGRTRLSHAADSGLGGSLSIDLVSTDSRNDEEARCGGGPVRLGLKASLERGRLRASVDGVQEGRKVLTLLGRAALGTERLMQGQSTVIPDFWDVSGELDEADLGRLPYLCDRLRGRLSGKLSLGKRGAGTPELSANLLARGLSSSAHEGLDARVDLKAGTEVLRLEAELRDDKHVSRFDASIPLAPGGLLPRLSRDEPLFLNARLNGLPVGPLVPRDAPISYATGRIGGKLLVRGSVAKPRLLGSLRLDSAGLVITEIAQPLRDIKGEIRFDNREIAITGLEASDQNGSVRADGRIEIETDGGYSTDMRVAARSFPLRKEGQVFARLDLAATVEGAQRLDRGEFEIVLRDTSIWLADRPLRTTISLQPHPDLVGRSSPDPAPSTTPRKPQGRAILLHVVSSEPLWIQRDDFSFQITTDLDIRIEEGRARIVGPVHIRRGFLDLLGQTFVIEPGSSLGFVGAAEPNPTVELSARHLRTRGSDAVRVHVSGRVREPKLVFTVGDRTVTAGEALVAIQGGGASAQAEQQSRAQMTSVLGGLAAGVLAVSVRREIGGVLPVLTVETGDEATVDRVRAGAQLDRIVPDWLRPLVQGIYVEGIVGSESVAGSAVEGGQNKQWSSGVRGGVLLELDFPHDLVGTGQYGPGETWSVDLGWEP